MSEQKWKCGNEYLPYHRSASHVNPDHRDGWNACYAMAHSRIEADEALMRQALEVLGVSGCLAFRNIPCRCSKVCDSFTVGTALRARLEGT